jgi:hypothetical protein
MLSKYFSTLYQNEKRYSFFSAVKATQAQQFQGPFFWIIRAIYVPSNKMKQDLKTFLFCF